MGVRSDALSRLFDAFSKKPTPGKTYYYEKWAGSIPANKVEEIVDHVVMTEEYLPTPSKLFAMTGEREKADGPPQEDCWFCEGTGRIPGIWRDKNGSWTEGVISACRCSTGAYFASKYLPQNNFEYDERYLDLMRFKTDQLNSPHAAVINFWTAIRTGELTDEMSRPK